MEVLEICVSKLSQQNRVICEVNSQSDCQVTPCVVPFAQHSTNPHPEPHESRTSSQ